MTIFAVVGWGCDSSERENVEENSTSTATFSSSDNLGSSPTSSLGTGNDSSTQPETTNPDPAANIVPGQGQCPDGPTLLAAPSVAYRELFVGMAYYRTLETGRAEHEIISNKERYDAFLQEIKLDLPEVDFSKERVVFGSVVEMNSCFMKAEPLRSVRVNGKHHLDFTAVEPRLSGCNTACATVDEKVFVVAIPIDSSHEPTICTRKRIDCPRHGITRGSSS